MRTAGFISIQEEAPGYWVLSVQKREGGDVLYEARGLKSLDEVLEDLDRWRKGVVIV